MEKVTILSTCGGSANRLSAPRTENLEQAVSRLIHDLAKHTHKCHATGRVIRPGETYYSALVETMAGQERWDFAEEAWSGPPEGTVGHWKGTLPPETQAPAKPAEVPIDVLLSAFERLAGTSSEDPQECRLRYVLTLMLVRKRALKLHSMKRDGDRDTLVVRRPPSQETIDIPDPGLDEASLVAVESELHAWLESAVAAGEV